MHMVTTVTRVSNSACSDQENSWTLFYCWSVWFAIRWYSYSNCL